MTELSAVDTLMDILTTDSTITSLVSTFTSGTSTVPMIIYADMIPSEWGIKACTLNMYTLTVINNLEYNKYYFRIACRDTSYGKSRLLATAVVSALNRNCKGNVMITAEIQTTLIPENGDLDNFNTPVDILIRSN